MSILSPTDHRELAHFMALYIQERSQAPEIDIDQIEKYASAALATLENAFLWSHYIGITGAFPNDVLIRFSVDIE